MKKNHTRVDKLKKETQHLFLRFLEYQAKLIEINLPLVLPKSSQKLYPNTKNHLTMLNLG